jgi:hypothetical protein
VNRRRGLAGGAALGAVFLALPSLVLAATLTVNGSVTGTMTASAPTPSALCTPTGFNPSPENRCNFTAAGSFSDTALGTGTHAGSLTLDWSMNTATGCRIVSGTIIFSPVGGGSSLSTNVDATTSRVCGGGLTPHPMTLELDVTGGTGTFTGATGTLTATGTVVEPFGAYSLVITGSVTTQDPSPSASSGASGSAGASASGSASPSPSPSGSPSAASGSPAASVGAGGVLPDTAAATTGMGALALATLSGLVVAASVFAGANGRRRK